MKEYPRHFERVGGNLWRLKVAGGWLVQRFCDYGWGSHTSFYPDTGHDWVLKGDARRDSKVPRYTIKPEMDKDGRVRICPTCTAPIRFEKEDVELEVDTLRTSGVFDDSKSEEDEADEEEEREQQGDNEKITPLEQVLMTRIDCQPMSEGVRQ